MSDRVNIISDNNSKNIMSNKINKSLTINSDNAINEQNLNKENKITISEIQTLNSDDNKLTDKISNVKSDVKSNKNINIIQNIDE